MSARWQTSTLGEILEKTATVNPLQSPDTEFDYIDVSSVSNETFRIGETQRLKGKDAPSRARRLVRKKDVLLATIRPTLQRIAIVPDEFDGQVCSTGYFVLRPKSGIDYRFVFYYLFDATFMDQMEALQKGASYPAVTDAEVRGQPFAFPPLAEQHRIVGILDEAFDGIATAKANAEKNLQNARALFESHLQAVFTQRRDGWLVVALEKVTSIVNGFAFSSSDFSPSNTVNCIKITNVGVGEFVEDTDSFLPTGFNSTYADVAVRAGDIVLALTRTIIADGLKVATVPKAFDGALLNQRVAAIRSKPECLHLPFLFAFLGTNLVSDYVRLHVNTLMQPNLSIKDLRSMPIPLPPIHDQVRITADLLRLQAETQRLESLYQQKLTALDALKKSLLHQAFSGAL